MALPCVCGIITGKKVFIRKVRKTKTKTVSKKCNNAELYSHAHQPNVLCWRKLFKKSPNWFLTFNIKNTHNFIKQKLYLSSK